MKAVIYARYSSDNQREESIEGQIRECTAFYDDKLIITFNYKEGSRMVTFGDIKTALSQENIGSDMVCSTAPIEKDTLRGVFFYWEPQNSKG